MSDIEISFVKKPSAERRTLSVDFSSRLPAGVTVSAATVGLAKAATLENLSESMLVDTDAAVPEGGSTASFTVLGGESGQDYKIRVVASLSNDDELVADVMLRVQDY